MHYPKLTIHKKNGSKKGAKGRSFSAHLVAMLSAPELYPAGSPSTVRPLLLAYTGTPSAVRAMTANLRSGELGETDHQRFELLRSFGYRFHLTTPVPHGALAIAYLPELFHLRPGAPASGNIRFVHAPPRWWLDDQERRLAPEFGAEARHHAWTISFVARLDARCSLPIANCPGFHAALAERALEEPWARSLGSLPRAFDGFGCEELGLETPVLCDISPAQLADWLSTSTAELLPHFVSRSLRRTVRRLPASAQLSLAFTA